MRLDWPMEWPRPTSISWLNSKESSCHSKTAVVQTAEEALFLKIYGLPGGAESTFKNRQEIDGLTDAMEDYRAGLSCLGVPIAENKCRVVIACEEHGVLLLYVLESYQGECQDLAFDDPRIMAIIASLLGQTEVRLGIDPKPSNFVVSVDGKVSYIDLVWPLNNPHGPKVLHPESVPTWRFRYFSKVGIVLNWYIQFARACPEQCDRIILAVKKFLSLTGNEEVLEQFRELPGINGQTSADIPLWNCDVLRAVAFRAHIQRKISRQELEQVLRGTRTNLREPLPKEWLEGCKKILALP